MVRPGALQPARSEESHTAKVERDAEAEAEAEASAVRVHGRKNDSPHSENG